MVCKSVNEKIPYFNAPIYLENKTQIGRVDEILGPINQVVPKIEIPVRFLCTFVVFYGKGCRGRCGRLLQG